ncbi:HTH-type transcriptional regulator VirS [Mesorhizobium sp. L-8-10]|uniref:AraC family transcriptional regulator n=1 Tax=unclassified Mesorhizobium TaxID=325217 RepID=UPI0019280D8F|nr:MULTISPECIES: AraC family transcriptional regulator [unclassified Mesorhizobium]BCH22519.1 HTH-type transcriptional regulator VirS [Mesorhizobium sp. L-8-3]BCH30331.1 HTH-type transcriptional regulator VirS [Mesorhizobium sp. L-8-10]
MTEKAKSQLERLAAAPTAMGLATRLGVDHLRRLGIDPEPLLDRCGLSRFDVAGATRIDVISQMEFLAQVSRATRDDWVGLTLARDFDLREAGMLYYVASSSHRLGDALARLQRYSRIGNEALVVQIERGVAGCVRLSYTGAPRHRDSHFMEFAILVLLRLSRHLVGRELVPTAASFIHHRSGDLRGTRRALGCDVQFGACADEISFDAASFDLPLAGDDPFLNRLMVTMCEEAMAARSSNLSPFRTTVENAIAPLLPHAEADSKTVAGKVGLSERTFARRLAAEGLSFRSILDDLRRDLALRYLGENLQASQIAWLLGFHQASSFSHACRRWTGKSPSQHRREARAAPA